MSRKIIDVHVHVFPDNVAQRATDNIGKYYNIKMEYGIQLFMVI